MPTNQSDHDRVYDEVTQILSLLEGITGLVSNWNSVLRLDAAVRERGSKPFGCEIVLRADLASDPARWRTLIHEALHSLSVGYTFPNYNANRGWEEGVVEQLQRLLRPQILTAMKVDIAPAVFDAIEAHHLFQPYIEELEAIRLQFASPSPDFYLELLRMPINRRYAKMQTKALQLQGAERSAMVRCLAEANTVLTRKLSL